MSDDFERALIGLTERDVTTRGTPGDGGKRLMAAIQRHKGGKPQPGYTVAPAPTQPVEGGEEGR